MNSAAIASPEILERWWDSYSLSSNLIAKPFISVAQVTDVHLYADKSAQYFGANCYQHFRQVCEHIQQSDIDLVVITGDVTNDHTEQSYQHLATIVKQTLAKKLVAWLPGNHDEIPLMYRYFSGSPFITEKHLLAGKWQLFLMNSKSDTPAGFVTPSSLESQQKQLEKNQSHAPFAGAFIHHHLSPLHAYIDKHICENGDQVLETLTLNQAWRFLAHGHVHSEKQSQFKTLEILATPATSVQFGQSLQWQQINSGPAYRTFRLYPSGEWQTQVIALNNKEQHEESLNE